MLTSEDDLELDLAASTGQTLIQAYGLYWSRDAVDWDKMEIAGERRHYRLTSKNAKKKVKSCNIWGLRGIYALYSNFELVYVGLAGSAEGIGSRLQSHNVKPRFERRWDAFSWFSIDGFNDNAVRSNYQEHPVSADTLVRSFELITMLVADPPLNRSQGRFKGAEQIIQANSKRVSKLENVEDLLKKLLEKMKDR